MGEDDVVASHRRGSSPPSPPPFVPLDAIYVSEQLTPLPELKPAGETDITFDGQLPRPLRLHEDVRAGCGGQTWPAGMVLGKHMLRYHREELRDARILELGAGGGLVGLAVALGCGIRSRLMLTDQEEMLELMKHNIQLNELGDRAVASILNWGEQLPREVVEYKPDVVLAGECVYFEPAFPLLMRTLEDLFALNAEAVVYFCFKRRRRADMQFVRMARKAFTVQEVFDDDRPVFSRQSLFLFTFEAKRRPAAAEVEAGQQGERKKHRGKHK